MSRFRGFTLLEMLVVITIVGILIGGAALSLGLLGRDAGIQSDLQGLQRALVFARDRAEIEQRPYGVLIEPSEYRFVTFDARTMQWQEIRDEGLPRETWTDGLQVELDVEGRKVVVENHKGEPAPQIGIDPSGEFTAFELRLRRDGTSELGWLRPDINGALEWGLRP